MHSIVESFQYTTPTGWIISTLLLIIVFFLKRFIKSFDSLQESVSEIKTAIVQHTTIVDEHERRITDIEDKVYKK